MVSKKIFLKFFSLKVYGTYMSAICCNGNHSSNQISPKTLCRLSPYLMDALHKMIKIGQLTLEIYFLKMWMDEDRQWDHCHTYIEPWLGWANKIGAAWKKYLQYIGESSWSLHNMHKWSSGKQKQHNVEIVGHVYFQNLFHNIINTTWNGVQIMIYRINRPGQQSLFNAMYMGGSLKFPKS